MGLQKELGVSPVVANFGDGTVAKLAALGELGSGWAKNQNIIKIIRYGLFCKGYTGGYSDTGYYDPDITLAVKHMQGDMGLSRTARSIRRCSRRSSTWMPTCSPPVDRTRSAPSSSG
ncbi:hypothetical protein [Streptomyces sp. NPDC003996]